jgi:hypothetical protein
MRLDFIVINGAAAMIAFLVSFAFLTWRDGKTQPPTTDPVADQTAGHAKPSTDRDPERECKNPSLELALSSLARATGEGQREPQPPTPKPLSDLTKLALRYTKVNAIERKAWNMALRRVNELCQDSLGDKRRLRFTYDVRLQGRKATFDLRDTIVEEGAPVSTDLARCIETVASRIDLDLEAGSRDFPTFEGSTEWSFLLGKEQRHLSENMTAGESKPGPARDAR